MKIEAKQRLLAAPQSWKVTISHKDAAGHIASLTFTSKGNKETATKQAIRSFKAKKGSIPYKVERVVEVK